MVQDDVETCDADGVPLAQHAAVGVPQEGLGESEADCYRAESHLHALAVAQYTEHFDCFCLAHATLEDLEGRAGPRVGYNSNAIHMNTLL
eukprot:4724618-Amphidinium_carterae.1